MNEQRPSIHADDLSRMIRDAIGTYAAGLPGTALLNALADTKTSTITQSASRV